ncbi:MAG: hypothetical protein JNN28_14015, partial [Saprospiraceae bacterium]|nr:hypothetical protein [Saprospiraceae bacterium]
MQSKSLLTLLLALIFSASLSAQTQTIRGQVLDQQSETPLIGATVQVLNLETGI